MCSTHMRKDTQHSILFNVLDLDDNVVVAFFHLSSLVAQHRERVQARSKHQNHLTASECTEYTHTSIERSDNKKTTTASGSYGRLIAWYRDEDHDLEWTKFDLACSSVAPRSMYTYMLLQCV